MSHHIKITALVVLVLAMALSIHADESAPAPESTAPISSPPAPPADADQPAPAPESTAPISSPPAPPADAVSPSSDGASADAGASVGISPSPGASEVAFTGDDIFSASWRPGACAGAGALVAAVIAIYAM
ncbi:hypothetical protein IHE45_15G119400 [Dioscorea alata]|uniref:Uncharacterized protein n=1 Tax=Dioscorea alata TaxID=55571 RepID=A0ACB7UP66_DIOAL|nr:hypothetical protein IHE45_15G119400 [Dioscorea alata]